MVEVAIITFQTIPAEVGHIVKGCHRCEHHIMPIVV